MNPNKDRLKSLMLKVDSFVNKVTDLQNKINNDEIGLAELLSILSDLNFKSGEIENLLKYNNYSDYLFNSYFDKWIDFMSIQESVLKSIGRKNVKII